MEEIKDDILREFNFPFQTVCPSARQYLGRHYDLHNVYGFSEGIATNKALTKIREKRPFIISRSTFPGYGNYGGHWTGDVLSDWSSMKDSITGWLKNFNLNSGSLLLFVYVFL